MTRCGPDPSGHCAWGHRITLKLSVFLAQKVFVSIKMFLFFQAKGPKGQKLALDTKIVDPHAPIEVIDPVFSDSVQVSCIL